MTFEDILAEAAEAEQAKAVYYAEESFANITEYGLELKEILNEGSNFDLVFGLDDIVFESASETLKNAGAKIGKFADDCWNKLTAAFDKVKEFFTKVINKVRIFVASKGSEKTLKMFNDNLDKETVKEVQFKYISTNDVDKIATAISDGVKQINDAKNTFFTNTGDIDKVNSAFNEDITSIAKAVTVSAGTKLSEVNSRYITGSIKSCNDMITKASECYKEASNTVKKAKNLYNEAKKDCLKEKDKESASAAKQHISDVNKGSFAVLKATNNMINVALSILKITVTAVKRCLAAAGVTTAVGGDKLSKGQLKNVSLGNIHDMGDEEVMSKAGSNIADKILKSKK